MSVAGTSRDSHSNGPSTHGRKRRLSPTSALPQDKTQSKLNFLAEKRRKQCEDVTDPPTNGSMSSASSPSDTNHFHRNSFTGKATPLNNHAKKPGQGKKLVIKNRKVKPDLPENYERQTWEKLREAIHAVHTETPISYSLEELYQAVENMCSHRLAAQLYDSLRGECRRHARSLAPILQRPEVDDVQFLCLVNKQWTDHCRQMIMIRSIFLYLDRTYAVPSTSVLSIWDLGLDLFGSVLMNQGRVQGRVVKGVLSLIHKERCGESINRGLVKSLLRMLVDLQMYQEVFELEFLGETEVVYRAEALRMMRDTEFTLPDYLAHVDRRLLQENDRLLHYLHKSTRKPLILCLEKQLIRDHQQEILEKGFESLLGACRYPELSLLYQLFLRLRKGLVLVGKAYTEQSLGLICKSFSGYIKKSGAAIVEDPERDKSMVQELLELKRKLDTVICEAFQENERLHNVVRESLESVVNRRQNKPAELIAKYVDALLRVGNKEWSDEELEKQLDRVMVLFRYIHGKDVFEAFYKKDLAKRLLLGKSASFDAEKSMLLKLKQECGPNFTSKLEGMFKDMELSREMMSSFKETRHQVMMSIDLTVNVLTMGYWPPYTPMEIVLPPEMVQYLEAFRTFYFSKHSGRKLQWQPSLGHCVLKAAFPHGDKELQVSLLQGLVLLLFNDTDRLSFVTMKQATGIEDGELRRTLQSLSLGKARVLLKKPMAKEVLDGDEFLYNKEFKHRMWRIKINQVQMKETVEENTATNERVFQDRQYQVDAAVVRIMKMRRTLPHNLLVSECLAQLRFHVRPSDLKKRMESLIDRDYIRRSTESSNIYEYIA